MLTDFKIYFLTWNVVGRSPIESLDHSLGLEEPVDPATLPDMYIIGLQEVSVKPQDLIVDILFTDPWLHQYKLLLHRWNYVKVRHVRLQGIMLMAFCKRQHLTCLRDIQTDYTRTGMGGIWGNKGGTGLRFSAYGCSVCVVNSHLASGDEFVAQRIEDYNSIIDHQKFIDPQTRNILSHDYVFWIGDLNFRIESMDTEEVVKLIESSSLLTLHSKDQLTALMKSGQAFSEFTETPPTFAPTYKFEVDGTLYNLKRKPAWTDRILFRYTSNAYNNVVLNLRQIDYRSHANYTQSDHKPVSSSFFLNVFKVIPDQPKVSFNLRNNRWKADDDNVAWYQYLHQTMVPSTWDWIGLYPSQFSSMEDHVGYVWASTKITESPEDTDPMYRVVFAEQGLLVPGWYRLLYIHGQFDDVLGMSDPFEVVPD